MPFGKPHDCIWCYWLQCFSLLGPLLPSPRYLHPPAAHCIRMSRSRSAAAGIDKSSTQDPLLSNPRNVLFKLFACICLTSRRFLNSGHCETAWQRQDRGTRGRAEDEKHQVALLVFKISSFNLSCHAAQYLSPALCSPNRVSFAWEEANVQDKPIVNSFGSCLGVCAVFHGQAESFEGFAVCSYLLAPISKISH